MLPLVAPLGSLERQGGEDRERIQPLPGELPERPQAEAVAVAEQLSRDPDRIFTPLLRPDAHVPRSHQMLDTFITHVNATRPVTGLDEIPCGPVRPHMFRRTMAMLTDQFAGVSRH